MTDVDIIILIWVIIIVMLFASFFVGLWNPGTGDPRKINRSRMVDGVACDTGNSELIYSWRWHSPIDVMNFNSYVYKGLINEDIVIQYFYIEDLLGLFKTIDRSEWYLLTEDQAVEKIAGGIYADCSDEAKRIKAREFMGLE